MTAVQPEDKTALDDGTSSSSSSSSHSSSSSSSTSSTSIDETMPAGTAVEATDKAAADDQPTASSIVEPDVPIAVIDNEPPQPAPSSEATSASHSIAAESPQSDNAVADEPQPSDTETIVKRSPSSAIADEVDCAQPPILLANISGNDAPKVSEHHIESNAPEADASDIPAASEPSADLRLDIDESTGDSLPALLLDESPSESEQPTDKLAALMSDIVESATDNDEAEITVIEEYASDPETASEKPPAVAVVPERLAPSAQPAPQALRSCSDILANLRRADDEPHLPPSSDGQDDSVAHSSPLHQATAVASRTPATPRAPKTPPRPSNASDSIAISSDDDVNEDDDDEDDRRTSGSDSYDDDDDESPFASSRSSSSSGDADNGAGPTTLSDDDSDYDDQALLRNIAHKASEKLPASVAVRRPSDSVVAELRASETLPVNRQSAEQRWASIAAKRRRCSLANGVTKRLKRRSIKILQQKAFGPKRVSGAANGQTFKLIVPNPFAVAHQRKSLPAAIVNTEAASPNNGIVSVKPPIVETIDDTDDELIKLTDKVEVITDVSFVSDSISASTPPLCEADPMEISSAIPEPDVVLQSEAEKPISKVEEIAAPKPSSAAVATDDSRQDTVKPEMSLDKTETSQRIDATSTPIIDRSRPAQAGNFCGKRARSLSSNATDARRHARPDAADDSDDSTTPLQPDAKRVRTELRETNDGNDRTLLAYIDRIAGVQNMDDVHRHVAQLRTDIDILDEMCAAKEREWNSILHLKRCKEEIVTRLLRREKVMQIMSTSYDEHANGMLGTSSSELVLTNGMQEAIAQVQPLLGDASSAHENGASGAADASNVSTASAAATILANCVNMKPADLAREKSTTTRLHSILFPRNILPKPSPAATTHGLVAAAASAANAAAACASEPTSAALVHPKSIGAPTQPSTGADNAMAFSSAASTSPILTNYITSNHSGGNGLDKQQQQQQLHMQLQHFQQQQNVQNQQQQQMYNELLMNGSSAAAANAQIAQIGRQGPIKDVKSIIDDYRQKHPETVPRRGRRRKDQSRPSSNTSANGGGLQPPQSPMAAPINGSDGMPMLDNSTEALLQQLAILHPQQLKGILIDFAKYNSMQKHEQQNQHQQQIRQQTMLQQQIMQQQLQQQQHLAMSHQQQLQRSVSSTPVVGSLAFQRRSTAVDQAAADTPVQNSIGAATTGNTLIKAALGYPEVTVHPVSAANSNNSIDQSEYSRSLLHDILTKNNICQNAPNTTAACAASSASPGGGVSSAGMSVTPYTFTPTLARLLTTPDRLAGATNGAASGQAGHLLAGNHPHLQPQQHNSNFAQHLHQQQHPLNSNFVQQLQPQPPHQHLQRQLVYDANAPGQNEITITPVTNTAGFQLQPKPRSLAQTIEFDDETEDSVDRLVIDEGNNNNGFGQQSTVGGGHDNSVARGNVPDVGMSQFCQGCGMREAQFVCAGCGNQWYCSKKCQVSAWDEHSDNCVG